MSVGSQPSNIMEILNYLKKEASKSFNEKMTEVFIENLRKKICIDYCSIELDFVDPTFLFLNISLPKQLQPLEHYPKKIIDSLIHNQFFPFLAHAFLTFPDVEKIILSGNLLPENFKISLEIKKEQWVAIVAEVKNN